MASCCLLYRIQAQDFICSAQMEKASQMENNAPSHMKQEPTCFTGLSLKLTVRLHCLCRFLVLVHVKDRREEREEKKKTKE